MTDEETNALLTRAREAGVRGFVVPATDGNDVRAVVALADRHPDVWAAVGYHPHEAKHLDDAAFEELSDLARHPRVVAIGEIGLDYHYDYSPRPVQRHALLRQIELAKSVGKPVIIHNRESTADLLEMLASDAARGARGILHSFTESLEVAETLISRSYYVSLSGIVTFRSADALREVAKALPRERVLIETDTPYLAPVPHRGRPNEPAFVVRIAELLADLWECTVEDVAAVTTSNFESAFDVGIAE